MRKIWWMAVILGVWIAEAHASAPKPVGNVVVVTGAPTLERNGKAYRLAANLALYNGDTITTPKSATVKIVLADDSLLTIGANSRFKLENLAVKDDSRSATFRLYFGKLRAVVTKFARGASELRFYTPTAVAGVRGTQLVLEYDQDAQRTTLSVLDGNVGFRSLQEPTAVELVVGPLQQSSQVGAEKPQPPVQLSPEQVQKIEKELAAHPARPSSDPATEDQGTMTAKHASPGAEAATAEHKPEESEHPVDQALEQAEHALDKPFVDETRQHLPTEHPAADGPASSGIRVRW